MREIRRDDCFIPSRRRLESMGGEQEGRPMLSAPAPRRRGRAGAKRNVLEEIIMLLSYHTPH